MPTLPWSAPATGRSGSGVVLPGLAQGDVHLRPLLVTTDPGVGVDVFHGHPGEEFLCVVSGQLHLGFTDDRTYALGRGLRGVSLRATPPLARWRQHHAGDLGAPRRRPLDCMKNGGVYPRRRPAMPCDFGVLNLLASRWEPPANFRRPLALSGGRAGHLPKDPVPYVMVLAQNIPQRARTLQDLTAL